ncbi:hypothetical protein PPOP_2185, partial [Paenibacillus popilliae ATCC 14706]
MENKQKASTRAKNKYNAANYEQINYWAKKGERVRVDAAAKSSGKSR